MKALVSKLWVGSFLLLGLLSCQSAPTSEVERLQSTPQSQGTAPPPSVGPLGTLTLKGQILLDPAVVTTSKILSGLGIGSLASLPLTFQSDLKIQALEQERPLSGLYVEALGIDTIFYRRSELDGQGGYTIDVPAGKLILLQASSRNGNQPLFRAYVRLLPEQKGGVLPITMASTALAKWVESLLAEGMPTAALKLNTLEKATEIAPLLNELGERTKTFLSTGGSLAQSLAQASDVDNAFAETLGRLKVVSPELSEMKPWLEQLQQKRQKKTNTPSTPASPNAPIQSLRLLQPFDMQAVIRGDLMTMVALPDNPGGVNRVEFYVNGALLGVSSQSPYQFFWNTSGHSTGTHLIRAVAKADDGRTLAETRQVPVEVFANTNPNLLLAPSGLSVNNTTQTSFTLSWGSVSDATSYRVYRDGALVSSLTGTSTTIGGLSANTTYVMQVQAINSSRESNRSSSIEVRTSGITPSIPTNLTASSVSSNSLVLNWNSASNASSYKVFRDSVFVSSTSSTSQTISGLSANTTYSLQVSATNGSGDSGLSSAISVTTPAAPPVVTPGTVPAAPTGLNATLVAPTTFTLNWTAVPGATSYKVYQNGTAVANSVVGTSHNLTGLTTKTLYNMEVSALNGNGESAKSTALGVTTLVSVALLPPEFDYNDDNIDDLLAGAPLINAGAGADQGEGYLFVGTGAPVANIVASAANVLMRGTATNDQFGYSIASAGDFNGDGRSDIIVGAPNRNAGAGVDQGVAYIFYGTAAPTTPLNAAAANVVLTGTASGDYFGASVSRAGDFNGDGFDDVVVGAWGRSSRQGSAYVFYGSGAPAAAVAASAANVILTGITAGDYFGIQVAPAGDFNKDNRADIMISSWARNAGAGNRQGEVYLFYGAAAPAATISASAANVKLTGTALNQRFGYRIAPVGDFNNDGASDIVVGAPGTEESYVFLGSAAPGTALSASAANVKLTGITAGDLFGESVGSAGDFNNDGFWDILIGAHGRTTSTGAAYVFFGSASPAATIGAAAANTTLTGIAAGDHFGYSVGVGGDYNNDNISDLMVGANWRDPGGTAFKGAAYLFLGSGAPAANIAATAATTTLTGTSAGNNFATSVGQR